MSRLLLLPLELRLTIFEMAVASEESITIPITGKKARPALLHVSRQIRAEATKPYYKFNAFRLLVDAKTLHSLPDFAMIAGAENMALITTFTIHCIFDTEYSTVGHSVNVTVIDAAVFFYAFVINIASLIICSVKMINELRACGVPRKAFNTTDSLSEKLPLQIPWAHIVSRSLLRGIDAAITNGLDSRRPFTAADLPRLVHERDMVNKGLVTPEEARLKLDRIFHGTNPWIDA